MIKEFYDIVLFKIIYLRLIGFTEKIQTFYVLKIYYVSLNVLQSDPFYILINQSCVTYLFLSCILTFYSCLLLAFCLRLCEWLRTENESIKRRGFHIEGADNLMYNRIFTVCSYRLCTRQWQSFLFIMSGIINSTMHDIVLVSTFDQKEKVVFDFINTYC